MGPRRRRAGSPHVVGWLGGPQDYIAQHALSIGVYDRLSTLAVSPKLKDVWQEQAQGGPVFYDAYFTK